MKLIKLTCPNCKANLEVDSSNKEFTCSYCRTKSILDEEIIKVEHIIADSFASSDFKVAQTYLDDFEDYEEAYSKFDKLTQTHPYEPEVWWGLILSMTKKLTEIELDYNGESIVNLELCDDYYDKYLKVEKNIKRKEVNEKLYSEYKEKLTKEITASQEEKERYEKDIRKIIIVILLICIVSVIGLNLIFN